MGLPAVVRLGGRFVAERGLTLPLVMDGVSPSLAAVGARGKLLALVGIFSSSKAQNGHLTISNP